MWMRPRAVLGSALGAGVAVLAYSTVIERNWFAIRYHEVPVLTPGARPLRILHLSDAHLTPGRHRLLSFIRTLDALEPDLVVNTGDSIAHEQAVGPLLDALGPLLARPGVFVFGSNDLYAPTPKNPLRYIWRTSGHEHRQNVPNLPWDELGAGLEAAGWMNASNRRGRIKVGDLDIEVAGVHDSHVRRDRYELVAGPADPAADLRLGVMHSPEPAVMDRFVADGFDLLLAGHTHGGQVCLPWFGTLVTNCGLDAARARGLSQHPAGLGPLPDLDPGSAGGDGGSAARSGRRAFLHVSAGLGTSPYSPFRFACRPEVTVLTLVPQIG
jgi:predicted MPP superfamily phosphohydrolase